MPSGGYTVVREKVPMIVAPDWAKIEASGVRALRWRKASISPLKPHGLIAPFGAQPGRSWCAKPPGRSADDTVEVGDSDDDAAEQHAIAFGFIGSLLARIDPAAAPGGEESAGSDADGGADGDAAHAWPGHEDRTAWAVSARAH